MGFSFGDLLDPFDLIDTKGSLAPSNLLDPGKDDREAAVRAQEEAGLAAIDEARSARRSAEQRLAPFNQIGRLALFGSGEVPGLLGKGSAESSLSPITDLLGTPSQDEQIKNLFENPLFTALGDDIERRLSANAAARGKLGSGGFKDLLTRELLRLGPQFIDRDLNQRASEFSRRFDLGRLGANAAAGQATGALSTGSQIGGLLTDIGSAKSAGNMSNAAQQNALFGNLLGGAGGAGLGALGLLGPNVGAGAGALLGFISDERAKENITYLYTDEDGLNVYKFNYIGSDKQFEGKMAQEIMRVDPDSVVTDDNGFYAVSAKYMPREEVNSHGVAA